MGLVEGVEVWNSCQSQEILPSGLEHEEKKMRLSKDFRKNIKRISNPTIQFSRAIISHLSS